MTSQSATSDRDCEQHWNGYANLGAAHDTQNTDGTPVTTLTGYHIYYGTTQGALTQSIAASAVPRRRPPTKSPVSAAEPGTLLWSLWRQTAPESAQKQRGFQDHLRLRLARADAAGQRANSPLAASRTAALLPLKFQTEAMH